MTEATTTEKFLCGVVDALHMAIPMEGQRYLWKEMNGESEDTKIICTAFLLTYQVGMCSPVVYSLYKLGEHLINFY